MTKTNHPIEQEELMAYLDGELATDRAVTAAAHLEHCQECQRLAADLKGVSQKLMEWEVETAEPEIMPEIAAALEEREKQPKKVIVSNRRDWKLIFSGRKRLWVGGLATAGLVALLISVQPSRVPTQVAQLMTQRRIDKAQPVKPSANRVVNGVDFYSPEFGRNSGTVTINRNPESGEALEQKAYGPYADTTVTADLNTGKLRPPPLRQATPPPSGNEGLSWSYAAGAAQQNGFDIENGDLAPANGPLIVRTAGLTVTVKEFDKARIALDEILKRHHGYMGELNVTSPSDAGRTVTATLRVPAVQLDTTLAELKTLGRVEGESQGGEEVTQQYVDLQARLANAKHTEQRLTDILRQRTGKLSDVLAVEVQIGRVRGEIERMQAEKKELAKQVQFATLNATVKEDYKAPMQIAPPSTSNRFHNAAVDGYRSVVEGLVDVLLFLLSSGPSLLVWAAILFFPVRWAWRKLKKNLVKEEAPTAS